MKTVYTDIIHKCHFNIINEARKYGKVTAGDIIRYTCEYVCIPKSNRGYGKV